MGIWWASANSSRRVRLVRSHSRQGGDHFDVGLQRIITQFEAHLVVALAGGAMGDGVGAHFLRDLDLLLGDQRPRDGGAQQIDALIDRIGAEHRKHESRTNSSAHILDEDVLRLDAQQQRLLAGGFDLLALAEVGGEGHDLGAIFGLQPFEDDRRVQATRIGQHHLLHALNRRHVLLHISGGAEAETRKILILVWTGMGYPLPRPVPPEPPAAGP